MQKSLKKLRLSFAALLAALLVGSMSPTSATYAQSTSTSTPTSATLSESTIKVLQEALNKQGITVKTDGVLNDETRNALRTFQSKHHLSVTGEADKATLDKLGVVAQLGTVADSPSTVGQVASPSTPSPQAQTQPGQEPRGMMSGPMMQGMMRGMMETMQGMMGMESFQQRMITLQLPGIGMVFGMMAGGAPWSGASGIIIGGTDGAHGVSGTVTVGAQVSPNRYPFVFNLGP
jgi:peptidoglycan hydrolase-like protein with peptidoglycan-binding domain